MSLNTVLRLSVSLIPTLMATSAIAQAQPNSNLPGKDIYEKSCATCHAAPTDIRTPKFSALTALTAAQLRATISEGGKMAPIAAALSVDEKNLLIAYLTSGQQATVENWIERMRCAADKRTVDVAKPVVAFGYRINENQTRSLSAQQAGIKKADLKNLEIAWVIGFPGQSVGGTGTAILGDTLFATGGGQLLALDAASGCAKWAVAVNTRNTPSIGDIEGRKVVALVSGSDALVFDAKTGKTIWQVNAQATDNLGWIRGGVVFHKDKVIVPISASGIVAGLEPTFECCVGHGAVVALSAKDGTRLWEYHTMPTAQYTGKVSPTGVKQRGPSGAPIWSMPLIDGKRNRVIVATGENTSHPATDTSDAVIALDLDTGKEIWKFQAMANDVWNLACSTSKEASGPNCPWRIEGDTGVGRDFDFGAGPVLVQGVSRKDIVLAGQKSGDVWALDAETGKRLWNVRFGRGTISGGVHWGLTTDGERVFAPINDPILAETQDPKPGVFALDIHSGKPIWGYDAKPNCVGARGEWVLDCSNKYGFSAAPLMIDGAVVAATIGGEVFIFDGKSGEILNRLDTVAAQKTINGIEAKGGSIDSHALSAGAGMLFINSGYGQLEQTPGNALIAYRAKK